MTNGREGALGGGTGCDGAVGCVVLVKGDETVRGATLEADREGPSLEATKADLSMNFLYSYFAELRK